MADGTATVETAQGAAKASFSAAAARTGFSIPRMMAVMRKELRSYFAFPLVYLLSGIFLVLAGFYAWSDMREFITFSFSRDMIQNYWQLLFSDLRLCLLLAMPFVTMRSFAEERKLGTVELLYTYPLRDGEILGGKFLAAAGILKLMLALTLLFPAYLYTIQPFPLLPLISGYVGLLLMGLGFIACGLFISSLCESQVVAGVGTIVLLLFFWILNWNEAAFQNEWLDILRDFSLYDEFGPFAKGVIELDHVTFFLFFIIFFLFLTMRSMEARKWTGRR
ncbi:MAG TPA: ABC transporter permease [Candidatus Binataceae bacterium]|nr:ABC transporter permease [Candidatus Binataceae bacterium]